MIQEARDDGGISNGSSKMKPSKIELKFKGTHISKFSICREMVIENDVNIFIIFIVDGSPEDLFGFLE